MLSQQDGYLTSLILVQMIQSALPVQLSYIKTIYDLELSWLQYTMKSSWVSSHVYMETVSTISGTICLHHQGVAVMNVVFAGKDRHSQMVKCVLCSHTTFICKALVYPSPDCVGEEWVSQMDHLSLATILHDVCAAPEKSFVYKHGM
jgi:hypothetical protein